MDEHLNKYSKQDAYFLFLFLLGEEIRDTKSLQVTFLFFF